MVIEKKRIIKEVIASSFRLVCKLGVVKPSKVVVIEGDICSQI